MADPELFQQWSPPSSGPSQSTVQLTLQLCFEFSLLSQSCQAQSRLTSQFTTSVHLRSQKNFVDVWVNQKYVWAEMRLNWKLTIFFVCRLIAYGQQPLAAVTSARLHHQLYPDTVAAESWQASGVQYLTSNSTIAALRSRGHNVTLSNWGAVSQVILVDSSTRTLISASDPRKDGAPSGY